MQPVVTVEEMRAIDAAAQRDTPVETLIERAGAVAAHAALDLLGGAYGRRVVVVAGKGHNGDDGRVAARHLAARGARVTVIDVASAPPSLPEADLVVDAAFGTGFRGEYDAPRTDAPVLALDIPSGVDGDTGQAGSGAVRATATVTFAAWKPGLLLGDGPERAGRVRVADIGLDCSCARAGLVGSDDLAARVPRRTREWHKWKTAVGVVAGAPGMMGAATFCTRGALRAGAGMVRLAVPGAGPADLPAAEAVATGLPAEGWAAGAAEWVQRCGAVVVGPGLGRAAGTAEAVRRLVADAPVPVLVDADGLHALGRDAGAVLRTRSAPTVLTPHAGEFEVLTGAAPGPDRLAVTRSLAADTGAVVLLKGSTTVVAGPDGRVLLSAAGGPGLATAGTGDVLSGVIAAFLASGLDPLWGAALGAHTHGVAGSRGLPHGLVAGDLPELVAAVLSELVTGDGPEGGP
ncbi:MAG TPA: NAD(P)H-hydrate dehydratase [Acidimicrobiales bacterium]|nr:NAD(P)H-hydrate dehydratase [Acidimicrobiales bacterium]